MKRSEFRTDGAVFTRILESIGEDGRTHRQKIRFSTHKRHSPWTDCPTCLAKHRAERKARGKRQRAARKVNR